VYKRQEDRNERGGERAFAEEAAREVGDRERDIERGALEPGADEVRHQPLAHEPEHAAGHREEAHRPDMPAHAGVFRGIARHAAESSRTRRPPQPGRSGGRATAN